MPKSISKSSLRANLDSQRGDSQWYASKLPLKIKVLICSVHQFLWCKYPHSSMISCCSVAHVVSDSVTPWHSRLPCPSLSPRVCSKSCPLNWWCHPAISSSVVPFSSCPRSFPASGSFPVSQLFTSGGQSIGVSASVLQMTTQSWFPLGLTGLITLLSKGLSRIFSSTMIQKHQNFCAQSSLWSNSHIHTWLLERP